MLEGTDLSSAYGSPLMQRGGSMFEEEDEPQVMLPPPSKNIKQSTSTPVQLLPQVNPIQQQLNNIQASQQMVHEVKKPVIAPQQPQQFNSAMFNRSFDMYQQEQQQRIQQQQQQIQHIKQMPYIHQQEPSYWDKLSSKKKETGKFIQSALIILFAISLHVVIDFVLKHYLEAYDISWNRELAIRILYPLAILFLAWNIITFIR